MENCWKFENKAAESVDLFVYGDITSHKWDESDVTAKNFVDELKECNGKNLVVHINSGGGDVFAATAIANSLKGYKGNVIISVEGICASAATIIACAGDSIKAARNSIFMVHNPTVGLVGYFDENEVAKVQKSLSAVKNSIITTYQTKTGKTADEISEIMTAETWYTAEEALENKFVDEISGEVESNFDDSKKILFVNSLQVDCKNFDVQKLKNKLEVRKMTDEKSLLAKIKNLLGSEKTPATVDVKDDVADIREKELSRIKNLSALKTGNNIVDGIVDVAIRDGATVEEIQKYVDVAKKYQAAEKTLDTDKTARAILNLIEDNLKSGAEGVTGSTPPEDENAKRTAQAKMLADYANGLI